MLKNSKRKHCVVFLDKDFAFYRARNRNEKLGFEKQVEIGKSGSKKCNIRNPNCASNTRSASKAAMDRRNGSHKIRITSNKSRPEKLQKETN